MKKVLLVPSIALLLSTLACVFTASQPSAPSRRVDTPTAPPAGAPIADIIKVSDDVQVNQTPVPDAGELYENEELGLFNGGEGLLNFGGALVLRMFNDTKFGGVHAEADPNAPVLVRMRLIFGGFTGDLNQPGKEAVFDTPNGAQIVVKGTQFFIVYDPEKDITTVGNFSGTISVSAAGEAVDLADGHYLQVVSGDPPGAQMEIPFTRVQFEDRARQLASPVNGLTDLLTFTPTPTRTTRPTITVTPIPPDTEPPVIFIDYTAQDPTSCGGYSPSAVTIIADVRDESEIASMTAHWVLGNDSGSIPMEKIDDMTYQVTIDSFRSMGELHVFVRGEDVLGNRAASNEIIVPISVYVC